MKLYGFPPTRSMRVLWQFLVGDNVTVADFVAAYTLDIATVQQQQRLLDDLPRLRGVQEIRMVRTVPVK